MNQLRIVTHFEKFYSKMNGLYIDWFECPFCPWNSTRKTAMLDHIHYYHNNIEYLVVVVK